jgi:hypothetical protein
MCRAGISSGVNAGVVSVSGGATVIDPNCEMLRRARLLNDLGLKVASVALMCQTDEIFVAMLHSGSPCPYLGSLGASAERAWYEKRPDLFKKVFGEDYTPPTVTYPME